MITLTDKLGNACPAVLAICPATRKIAKLQISVTRNLSSDQIAVRVFPIDTTNQIVAYDRRAVRAMTKTEQLVALAMPAVASDTLDIDLERRLLPYLISAFGVTVVLAPGLPSPLS